MAAGRMKAVGHTFRTPGAQHALVAFHRALAVRAWSKPARHRSIVEGGMLAQPKDLPVVLVSSATVPPFTLVAMSK